jgi:hypothetical protein
VPRPPPVAVAVGALQPVDQPSGRGGDTEDEEGGHWAKSGAGGGGQKQYKDGHSVGMGKKKVRGRR